jgi:asparagine synthase (glutamine-hydrolysing)
MCGIAGLIDFSAAPDRSGIRRSAQAMADALAHRGPDGADVWSDPEAAVTLAHRRLAIVDLTPTGAQPMVSSDRRWVISYNGEVYNAEEIAVEPQMTGLVRRGTSDTEVIVESVARRGLDRTLADLNGMFAIALWDRATRTLHLVRDRLGIKPLFYGQTRGGFCFASELKSFAAAGFAFEIDPASVASFLRFGYVPAPFSIYRDVAKVRPGEVVSVDVGGELKRRNYWSIDAVAQDGLRHQFTGSDAQAEELLHDLLADAVSANMISDVPLGAFLSGGIDSSTVAALMVAAKRGPVRTFSIGFSEIGYDESRHARAVAEHLKTEHSELTVTNADALNVVPHLADMYDEPFADSSQIPTHLISKLTRAYVTVALSGDGGDELFAGYNRYNLGHGVLGMACRAPAGLRRVCASMLNSIPDYVVEGLARLDPTGLLPPQPADKLKKLASVLPLDREAIYMRLVSQNPDSAALTFGVEGHPLGMTCQWEAGRDRFVEQMQLFDTATYLPDDILQKVDRASMAVSLEVRPPLLDHRVVAFAWRLPRRMRIRDGETKWLLRRVLDRYVPRELVSRPKMGFAIPLASWLRGPLRPWAEDLLDPSRLGGGLLDVAGVRKLWAEHIGGRRNWAYALWAILMYEAWRRRWALGVAL